MPILRPSQFYSKDPRTLRHSEEKLELFSISDKKTSLNYKDVKDIYVLVAKRLSFVGKVTSLAYFSQFIFFRIFLPFETKKTEDHRK